MGCDCSYALSRAPPRRQLHKTIGWKYQISPHQGDDYDEGGDDGAGNDDDDNAAVLPLSTFWAWSERGPLHRTKTRATTSDLSSPQSATRSGLEGTHNLWVE